MGLFDKFKVKADIPRECHDAVSGIPFPAYKGRDPYIFISYAHVDSPVVFPLIAQYYDLGYNVWYDEGIEPGIEWPEEIGKALGGSKLFVVFMSPAAADSHNVRNEINFAIKYRIPLIAVYIEETRLTPGLDLQIGARQAIERYKMDKESYRRKFVYSFDAVLIPGMRPVVPFDEPVQQPIARASYVPPPAAVEPQTTLPACGPANEGCKWSGNRSIAISPGEDFDIEHGRLNKYLGHDRIVRLPEAVEIIGGFAFNNCPELESVIFTNDCGAIFANSFISCPNLSNITIGKSFSSIAPKVFIGCPNVRFSYYRGKKPDRFNDLFPDASMAVEIESDEDISAAVTWSHKSVSPSPPAGEPKVIFASPEFRRIVRAELNLSGDGSPTKAQCDQITSLSVCGDAIGRRFNAYTNNGVNVNVVPIAGSGETMVSVGRGSLDILTDIAHLRNLTKLITPYQSFYDLSPLADSRIEELDIAMNTLDDLSPLSRMKFLRKLTLSYSHMDSLVPVGRCKALEWLTFSGISQLHFDELCAEGSQSLTMLLISDSKLHHIDNIDRLENLENLCINGTNITDIEPALKLKRLKKLGIKDVDIPDLSIIKSFTHLKVLTVNSWQMEEVSKLYGGEFPFKLF